MSYSGLLGQSAGAKSRPLALSSGINLQTRFYQSSDSIPRQNAFSYSISGSPSISLFGYAVPLRFIFSNQQSRFHQPFNQFGISPTFKWAKVYLGYNNIRFSDYSLNARRMLGAGFDLNPGLLRVGFVYGRFQKAVPADFSISEDDEFLLKRPTPSFKQTGFAAKLGIGTENNYFDLIFMKIGDRENSINFQADSTIVPQENAVVAIKSKVTLKQGITWDLDVGLSALTRNTLADTLSLDYGIAGKIGEIIFSPTESSSIALAGNTGISWSTDVSRLSLNYRRIDPGYRTLASYFFQSDLEEYTIGGMLRFWENRIIVNSRVGWLSDNIYDLESGKSKRGIYAFNIHFRPGEVFSLSSSYSNFGLQREQQQSVSFIDTLRIKQVSQSLNISPVIRFGTEMLQHQLLLSFNHTQLRDLNNVMTGSGNNQNSMYRLGYSLIVPSKWIFSPQFMYNKFSSSLNAVKRYTTGMSVQKLFEKSSARVQLQGNYNLDYVDEVQNRSSLVLGMTGSLPLFDGHNIQAQVNWLRRSDDEQHRTEFFSTISYSLRF